jgi:Undecaprenyl-phosphate glucose phosphotransferase
MNPRGGAGAAPGHFHLPVTYRGLPFLVAFTDVALILVSSVMAGSLYHFTKGAMEGEAQRTMAAATFVAVLFVAAMWMHKLYEPPRLGDFGEQFRGLAGAWIGAFLLLASGVFSWGVSKELSRGAILLFWAVGGALLLAHRQFWRRYLRQALASGALKGRDVVLVLWNGETAADHADLLVRHGYRIAKTFCVDGAGDADDGVEQIVDYVRGAPIDDIFLAPPAGRLRSALAAAKALRALPIPVAMLPDPALAELVSSPRYELGRVLAVEIQREPLTLGERAAKRVFDLVVATTSLIVFLPLFVLVALAIAIDSPGPVMFRQTRSGFNGRPFRIFKFRTMTVAEDGARVAQATKGDARVTRVGAWLRRTSIDELPQLLNVLHGEMSIVGPRPHAMVHDRAFAEIAQKYAFRHHVKAGMTGWAQVNGARGVTDTPEKIQRRVAYDLWYIKHWSLMLDASILLRTVAIVLQGKNAY